MEQIGRSERSVNYLHALRNIPEGRKPYISQGLRIFGWLTATESDRIPTAPACAGSLLTGRTKTGVGVILRTAGGRRESK
jgi:hypothetical protein